VIALPFTANERYAVLGLGASGLATARALVASGARVAAWDDAGATRDAALGAGIPVAPLTDADMGAFKALVLSPGIPSSFPKPHPVAAKAKAAGTPIICDVELLLRAQASARFFGVTGTNGKSTVTALLGHILHQAGLVTEIGGNLGPAALGLRALGPDGNYVIELSSYQLELLHSRALTVGVLLNITPDHLDRHGGMDGYIAAKRRLFGLIKNGGTAVIGLDDEPSRAIAAGLQAEGRLKVVGISANRTVGGGVYALSGRLVDDTAGRAERVLSLDDAIALPGVHNAQNAAAAFAVARTIGLDPDRTAQAIASYPGLAHRQERVATVAGILFVNDSKATNGDATSKALACYDTIYWIAGGLAKDGGIEGLDPFWPRIRHAYLIGTAADSFAATLNGHVPMTLSGTLETAVQAAFAQARADRARGAVVLLSPACASFDQFANFEARGEAFKTLAFAIEREVHKEGVSA
jgi:UDP-N-acetylmuramoylalanine--D-glutamate ligase